MAVKRQNPETAFPHYVVIIAGGKGERFWPQSRTSMPKHLLPVVGSEALLRQTIRRVQGVVPRQNILLLTSAAQEPAVKRVCRGLLPEKNIVAEPVGRDTAAAVGLAAALVESRAPEAVFAVLPADHVVRDSKRYCRDLSAAFTVAKRDRVMVTIGIKPTEPATGFGYIQAGKLWRRANRRDFFKVSRFMEKPKLEVAIKCLKQGGYVWNAGMFVWSVPVIQEAFRAHAPELAGGLEKIREGLRKKLPLKELLRKHFPRLPKISVDYAILEKSDNVVMLPSSFDWDDVGSWSAVEKHFRPDARGNVSRGPVLMKDASRNIAFTESGHLLAVLGVDDLVLVHTRDATLVCPKSRSQDVKSLVNLLAEMKGGQQWM